MNAEKIRAGTLTAAESEQLLIKHAPLAVTIASRYALASKLPIDSLVTEAMTAVVTAIEEAPTGMADDNFPRWATAKIHSELLKFWKNNPATQLKDELLGLAKTPIEKTIIHLRAESCTDQEIAQRVGLSADRVRESRLAMERRWVSA